MTPYERRFSIIISILGIIIGLTLLFMSIFQYQHIKNFVCVTIGIAIVIFNFFPLITYFYLMFRNHKYIFDFAFSVIGVLVGLGLITYHGLVTILLVTVFLIVLPTVRIIIAKDRSYQFKKEIALYLCAILVIFNVIDILGVIVMITFSSILIGISVLLLVIATIPTLIMKRRIKKNTIIDATFVEVEPEINSFIE